MAQKRKHSLPTSPPNPDTLKRRKMNSLYINNNDEDSDSDFDPYELEFNDITIEPNTNTNNTNPPNTNPPNNNQQYQHRYQTRSTSILDRNNSSSNPTNSNSIDTIETINNNIENESNNTNEKNNRHKRRGRPKSKRRKKKSNHIDTSKKTNGNNEELKERLSRVDKYDTQQYISSITNGITTGEYIHPFVTKPTSLPKKRISKIMKLDPTTFKISSITVELMAILIEIFIRDLVSRSYKYTIKDNRKSLQLQDICRAVQSDHMYDFLIDIIPRIQSYDQENNMYNFIYTSQMNNCMLTNHKGNKHRNQNQDQNQDQNDEEKEMSVEESSSENRLTIRRSERIKSKRSDKEEAD